jgi:hypothetical protein
MSTLKVNSILATTASSNAISLDSTGVSSFNWAYGMLGAPGSQTNASTSTIKITLNTDGLSNNMTLDTNNSRITAQRSGNYLCQAQISWSASAAGGAWTPTIYVYKNGSQLLQASWLHEAYTGGYSRTITVDRIISLAGGDYLELWWNQNTAYNSTFLTNTHLQAIFLGQ